MSSLNLDHRILKIEDDFIGYRKELFCIPKHYEDSIESVMIPYGMIKDRIEKLANNIFYEVTKSGQEPLHALCVLKGGFKFCTDLLDRINDLNSNVNGSSVPMHVDFIRLKSYANTQSTGEVDITGLTNLNEFKGRNLLVIEDIIDTGKTMTKLLNTLSIYEPKSISVACLLRKRTPLSSGYAPDHVGFEIPDKFVIGYALDYNEYFRDLMHICLINDHGIQKYVQ